MTRTNSAVCGRTTNKLSKCLKVAGRPCCASRRRYHQPPPHSPCCTTAVTYVCHVCECMMNDQSFSFLLLSFFAARLQHPPAYHLPFSPAASALVGSGFTRRHSVKSKYNHAMLREQSPWTAQPKVVQQRCPSFFSGLFLSLSSIYSISFNDKFK